MRERFQREYFMQKLNWTSASSSDLDAPFSRINVFFSHSFRLFSCLTRSGWIAIGMLRSLRALFLSLEMSDWIESFNLGRNADAAAEQLGGLLARRGECTHVIVNFDCQEDENASTHRRCAGSQRRNGIWFMNELRRGSAEPAKRPSAGISSFMLLFRIFLQPNRRPFISEAIIIYNEKVFIFSRFDFRPPPRSERKRNNLWIMIARGGECANCWNKNGGILCLNHCMTRASVNVGARLHTRLHIQINSISTKYGHGVSYFLASRFHFIVP